jgi:uncharacterized protein (TIGR03000 family)
MLQRALKFGLVVAALGLVVQEANAFGHHGGWGCGYAYGGWGYGGYGYGWGYGGWGYGGCGYGGWDLDGWYRGAYPWRPLTSNSRTDPDTVILMVSVPADAKVTINDHLTKSMGELRRYRYRGLQPTANYAYRVRAEYVRDGKPVVDEKTVQVTAGEIGSLAFSAAPKAQVPDVTTSAGR